MSIDKAIRLVHHVLRRNARERADKIALIFENERLTYAQIDEMSDRLANMFYNKGVLRGDRVLVFLPNSVELVISVFAIMKANAALVIVDSQTKFDRLQYIAQDCQATALVAGDYGVASRVVQCMASLRLAVIASEEGAAPSVLSDGFLAFDAALHSFPPVAPPQEVTDDDLAYLIYTSGSTGEPRASLSRTAVRSLQSISTSNIWA